jgi:hypothetical protein
MRNSGLSRIQRLRRWWNARKQPLPPELFNLDDAVMLCARYPGVRRARIAHTLANGRPCPVIVISVWPWRRSLPVTLVAEIAKRWVPEYRPKYMILRERTAKRILKEQEELE